MTLSEIEKIPREYLTPAEIAPFLGTDPQTIRNQANDNPDRLGFPVIILGGRIKIPKDGFVYFCRNGRPVVSADISIDAVKFFIDQALRR